MDVMIDLETVSTKNNAVILTLGALKFDAYSDKLFDGLYIKPNIEEQSQMGRHVDEETINWWAKQKDDVKNEAFGIEDRISVTEFLDKLTKFCWNADRIWAKGPMFDINILESLYKDSNKFVPWTFRQIRDVRTVCDMYQEAILVSDEAHNAFMDCLSQAKIIQQIYKKLGVKNAFNK